MERLYVNKLDTSREFQRVQNDHLARYEFAANYTRGKRVLDIACGSGYGSEILGTDRYIGVDNDADTIYCARNQYNRKGVLFFQCDAIHYLRHGEGVGSAPFDVIVSFETIEHMQGKQALIFLARCYDRLRKGGVLIISTPNANVTSPDGKLLTEYHKFEWYTHEFLTYVSRAGFVGIQLYGQRIRPKNYRESWLSKKLKRGPDYLGNVMPEPIPNGCEARYNVIVATST